MKTSTTDLWQQYVEACEKPAATEPVRPHPDAVTALPEEAKQLGLLCYVVSVVLRGERGR
jgi:hypothetical protein